MTADGYSFTFDPKDLMNGVLMVDKKALAAIRMFAETNAKVMESDAKEQARWTDRTGNARGGITGYVTKTVMGYRINLAYTVDYGIWLEWAHEKKYAIIEPIVRLTSPYIMEDFKGLLDMIGG